MLSAHCIYNQRAQGDWRGLQSMWVLDNMGSIHILHHRENDCTEMLCFIIYNFCIFFPLSLVHFSSSKLLFNVEVYEVIMPLYAIIFKGQYVD